MGWITVYVRGKSGFEAEVLKNLEHSGFPFMPGATDEKALSLFWISERKALRDFKKAISSKTIFKHRLRFFTNVEEFVESKYNTPGQTFLQQRASAMQELNSWYESRHN